MWACQWLSSDDISNHKKRRKNLITNLRHRQALVLTRPTVLLGEGRPDTRERRKSSLLVYVIAHHTEWLDTLIIQKRQGGKFECERVFNRSEEEKKGPRLVKLGWQKLPF